MINAASTLLLKMHALINKLVILFVFFRAFEPSEEILFFKPTDFFRFNRFNRLIRIDSHRYPSERSTARSFYDVYSIAWRQEVAQIHIELRSCQTMPHWGTSSDFQRGEGRFKTRHYVILHVFLRHTYLPFEIRYTCLTEARRLSQPLSCRQTMPPGPEARVSDFKGEKGYYDVKCMENDVAVGY